MDLPRRYGHYVLLERIAVGGMGEIFRASYGGIEGFERLCAIKRILPHLSDDEEFIDRLISEAKIAVQLTHVNVVQVYELGRVENDDYFIAMEWVDGPDLGALLTKARAKDIALPLPLAIHICHELARAIEYAHRKSDPQGRPLGIIHRDISPANVMLSMDGAVKLGDFGIARAGGIARKFATGMGAVLGKRRYMSPEQRRGELVDGRTDIYALGALLYECISGDAPDPESPLVPLKEKVKEVPPELDALVSKALAPGPIDRISNASELVEGLERAFMRLASAPGSVRDPALELGRFVKKVCPPGEKAPQRRSLTERMRAAMGVRAERPSGETGFEGTAAVTANVPIAALDGPEGVTIVHSAIVPMPPAVARPEAAPPRAHRPAETEIGPRPVFDDDRQTGSTETIVRPSAVETQIGIRPVIPSTPPVVAQTVPTSSELRRARAVAPLDDDARTGSTEIDPSRRMRAPGSGVGLMPFIVGGGFILLALAAALALPDGSDPAEVVVTRTPLGTPIVVKTAPPPTPVQTPAQRPTEVAKAPTPAPTPRRTATPKATPTVRVAVVKTPAPTPTQRPKVEGFGTLSIGTEGVTWAYVTLDGKRLAGTTPKFDLKVKAGVPHRIVLEHPELGRREVTITVGTNESKPVMVSFKAGR